MILKKSLRLLLLSVAVASLTSCLEEPKQDVDTPAQAKDVQEKLYQAWGFADPLTMVKDDFMFIETTQTLETNQAPFFVLQEGVTVSQKAESEDKTAWDYKFLYQTRTFRNNQEGAQSTREYDISITKSNLQASALKEIGLEDLKPMAEDFQLIFGVQKLLGLAGACVMTNTFQKSCREAGYDRCTIECLNLKSEKLVQDPPEQIKNQPNCGDLNNCQIRINKVTFDFVLSATKKETTEAQRINYSISMSQDLPFLARITQYCARQIVTVNKQKILVNTCANLKNFKKGPPELPQ